MRTKRGYPINAIFVRHGKAESAVNGNDQERLLSTEGLEQAQKRAASLKGLTMSGGLVVGVSSSARRAAETGAIVFGVPMVELPELYLPTDPHDRVSGDADFAYLGYRSLRDYIAHDRTGWIFRYGLSAVNAIRRVEWPSPANRGGPLFMGIVGHAVSLNLVAMLMFPEYADVLRDICLGEAEALVIGPSGLAHYGAEIIKY